MTLCLAIKAAGKQEGVRSPKTKFLLHLSEYWIYIEDFVQSWFSLTRSVPTSLLLFTLSSPQFRSLPSLPGLHLPHLSQYLIPSELLLCFQKLLNDQYFAHSAYATCLSPRCGGKGSLFKWKIFRLWSFCLFRQCLEQFGCCLVARRPCWYTWWRLYKFYQIFCEGNTNRYKENFELVNNLVFSWKMSSLGVTT